VCRIGCDEGLFSSTSDSLSESRENLLCEKKVGGALLVDG
jgi:hypothetical protein